MPILQRDQQLDLSKYRGSTIRQRLIDTGWIKSHKVSAVSAGRRSGQLILLEVTEAGYEFLAAMKIKTERPRERRVPLQILRLQIEGICRSSLVWMHYQA
jgi:hypothetical protein